MKEALDVYTLRRLAIKIIQNKKLRRMPNGQANVKREARLLRRLKHKNVVEMVDIFYKQDVQKVYFVMEYCAATLKEVLDSVPGTKKLPGHQVQDYLVQLLTGMAYIHSQGVIHRDIKPANLLLSNDEVLKLSDFGVAYELDRFQPGDACLTTAGTTPFQPPEVANADINAVYSGCKVDVWAAGVTLWNMSTGGYPFPIDEGSLFNLLSAIAKADYAIPEGVGPDLAHLLRSILEVDVAKRFTVAQVLQHRWVTARIDPASVAAEPRVPIPAREFKGEEADPDRGITVVEELDKMHGVDELRDRRLKVPLDDSIRPPRDSLDSPGSGNERTRTGSIGKLFRNFFSGGASGK